MSKVPEDIETLKKWAGWVIEDQRYPMKQNEMDRLAAKAVMNLIAYVGTLKAQTSALESRLSVEVNACELALKSERNLTRQLALAVEALGFYADEQEWFDYKAYAMNMKTGLINNVDSHFDGDLGIRARNTLAAIRAMDEGKDE